MVFALAVIKNKPRNGRSLNDLLRLSHFSRLVKDLPLLTKYITEDWKEVHKLYEEKVLSVETEKLLKGLEAVGKWKDELEVIGLTEKRGLLSNI